MKALLLTAPNQLLLSDWPTPHPSPGQVRIRTYAVGICATDLKMIAGWQRTGYPAIPGHEWSGWVEAVGEGVDPALVGRPCVAENVLRDGGEVGFEHPGAYAQYFLTEAGNVYPLPVDFPLTTAILCEPLAVAVHGLRRAGLLVESEQAVVIPERALIFGDGPLGLLLLLLLQHVGVGQVSLVGGVPERLRLASDLGATQVYSHQQAGDDLPGELRRAFGDYFPLVIEASGSERAMTAVLQLCGKGARVLVIGDYDDARADFSWNSLLHRELTLIGSNAGAGAWPLAVKLLVDGILPLERLVSHRFPPERFVDARELVQTRQDGVIKAAIVWKT